MVHDCNPFAGDKCNTIRLSTSNTIPYYFAPVIGINTGNDRGGERRVVQGCLRRRLEPARRRAGARPDGKHDATPTSPT